MYEVKQRAMRQLMRHVVPIYFAIRKGEDLRQFLHSAFVFSVSGNWCLLTAGHCIREMEAIRTAGYEIVHCRLADGSNMDAKYQDMVPFGHFEAALPVLYEDPNWDYGVDLKRRNYRWLLVFLTNWQK